LLSHANVHRQGTMNKGPLFFKLIFSQEPVVNSKRVFGYLMLHISFGFFKAD
jgi:hypothetical protein